MKMESYFKKGEISPCEVLESNYSSEMGIGGNVGCYLMDKM